MLTVFLLYQEQALPVLVRANTKAKGMRLTCRLGGDLTLTVPPGTPRAVIFRFLDENREAIGSRVLEARRRADALPATEETEFPWLGRVLPVICRDADRSMARREGDTVVLCLRGGDWAQPALERLRVRLAKPVLEEMTRRRAEALGLAPVTVTVRPMLGRYGSCQPTRRVICLNSYLTRMSEPVILSVIDHELTHLNHPGHDDAFYRALHNVCPEYDRCHDTLRRELDPYLSAVRLQRHDRRPHPALADFSSPII